MTIGMTASLTLTTPMPASGAPDWAGATWIGEVEESEVARLAASDRVRLVDAEGYRRARILVRDDGRPVGFVEVDVDDRPGVGPSFEVGPLLRGLATLPRPPKPETAPHTTPRISVVISTRDRPEMLRASLGAVLAVDYEDFEVIVVDNAPSTSATRDVVAECTDTRVRYLYEPVAGLATARNAGVLAATGEIVQFADDDVLMDRRHLRAIADAYARHDDAICVGGLVPSGELRTPTQVYFDERVSWGRILRPRVFRLHEPQPDLPLFPFSLGAFGAGANMSYRRDALLAMGGFDEALGVGSKTGGGEDTEMFVRTLYAGGSMVLEPAAIVWHRHRDDAAELRKQSVGYGIGLGAWAMKLLTQPRMYVDVLRRIPLAVSKLGALGETVADPDAGIAFGIPADATTTPRPSDGIDASRFRTTELVSVLRGPILFFQERFAGRNILSASSAGRTELNRAHEEMRRNGQIAYSGPGAYPRRPRPVVDGRMTPGSRIAAAAASVMLLVAGAVGAVAGAVVAPAIFTCIGLVLAGVLAFPAMRATWFVSWSVAASLTIGIGLGWVTAIMARGVPAAAVVTATAVGVVLVAWSLARDVIALRSENAAQRPARILAADAAR